MYYWRSVLIDAEKKRAVSRISKKGIEIETIKGKGIVINKRERIERKL